MSEHNDDKTWFRLERNSIRAAEAKFGVGHPRHDEAALVDEATHWYGCDSVHPDCHHPAERILTDLIAELVGDDGDGHELTPDGDACTVCSAIDRAEARLREVTGDE